MELYLQLFYEFAKTGLFAIGGGLATLPFLYEIGKKTGWYNAEDISDMIAISQSTPGPIGVNMATYVGFSLAGLIGGVFTTISLVLPSVIIIIYISKALNKFKESKIVEDIFFGIRPASTGLILASGLQVAMISMFDIKTFDKTKNILQLFQYKSLILGIFIFLLMRIKKIHPIFLILVSAVVGVIFKF